MIVLIVAIGLVVGSFLNVCIDRLPRGESIVIPPSHCDACGHRLAVWDLIPILSFLWLRGRCRYCGTTISWRLPLVEGMTGAAFGAAGATYDISPRALFSAAFLALLIVTTFIDLEHQLILNRVVYPGLGAILIASPWWPGLGLGSALLGAGIGLGAFLLPYWLSGGGMGAGDVKLATMVGAVAGFPQVFAALLLALVAGGVVAVILLLVRRKGRRDAIPFGPFLALGGGLTLFWGQPALNWYLSFFA